MREMCRIALSKWMRCTIHANHSPNDLSTTFYRFGEPVLRLSYADLAYRDCYSIVRARCGEVRGE
jgi:hypothetical protein